MKVTCTGVLEGGENVLCDEIGLGVAVENRQEDEVLGFRTYLVSLAEVDEAPEETLGAVLVIEEAEYSLQFRIRLDDTGQMQSEITTPVAESPYRIADAFLHRNAICLGAQTTTEATTAKIQENARALHDALVVMNRETFEDLLQNTELADDTEKDVPDASQHAVRAMMRNLINDDTALCSYLDNNLCEDERKTYTELLEKHRGIHRDLVMASASGGSEDDRASPRTNTIYTISATVYDTTRAVPYKVTQSGGAALNVDIQRSTPNDPAALFIAPLLFARTDFPQEPYFCVWSTILVPGCDRTSVCRSLFSLRLALGDDRWPTVTVPRVDWVAIGNAHHILSENGNTQPLDIVQKDQEEDTTRPDCSIASSCSLPRATEVRGDRGYDTWTSTTACIPVMMSLASTVLPLSTDGTAEMKHIIHEARALALSTEEEVAKDEEKDEKTGDGCHILEVPHHSLVFHGYCKRNIMATMKEELLVQLLE